MQACEQTPRITRGSLRNRPLALEGLPCDWHPAWRLVISHPATASEQNQYLRLDRDANFQIYPSDFSCLNMPPLRKKKIFPSKVHLKYSFISPTMVLSFKTPRKQCLPGTTGLMKPWKMWQHIQGWCRFKPDEVLVLRGGMDTVYHS